MPEQRNAPQCPEEEALVCGICIWFPESIPRVTSMLDPEDFYIQKHRLIFSAIAKMQVEGEPIDCMSICARLEADGHLEKCGGRAEVMGLEAEVATAEHVEHHCKLVKESAVRRRLIHAAMGLQEAAYNEPGLVQEWIDPQIIKLRELMPPDYVSNHWWRGRKFLNWDATPPEWIIQPFITPSDLMLCVANAGVGKSWFMIAMALQCGLGIPWLGRFRTRPTRTLYCDFDNHGDANWLRVRMRKVAAGIGLEEPFHECPEFGVMTRFHLPSGINLYRGDNVNLFRQAIQDGGYGLVILDTLQSVHGAERENDAGQMGIVMNRLREISYSTKAAIVIAHHAKKPNAQDNGSYASYRGSTTIAAQVDCMIDITRGREGLLEVKHTKARHTKELSPFAVSITEGTEDTITIQIEDEYALTSHKKDLAKAWLLTELWNLPEDKLPRLEGRISQVNIIKEAGLADIASDKVIREALKELEDAGRMDCAPGQVIGANTRSKYWRVVDRAANQFTFFEPKKEE
jgi:hypothetical protein